MGSLRVVLAGLLVAVFVVQQSEARSLKKRNNDDLEELLRELMQVSQRSCAFYSHKASPGENSAELVVQRYVFILNLIIFIHHVACNIVRYCSS